MPIPKFNEGKPCAVSDKHPRAIVSVVVIFSTFGSRKTRRQATTRSVAMCNACAINFSFGNMPRQLIGTVSGTWDVIAEDMTSDSTQRPATK